MNRAPHPFTLRQLQYIVAVAERKGFRRAAQDCHVAQPSLSAQIAQVEEALGVQLFERDKRRVMLTAAGQTLLGRARTVLLTAAELADAARTLADPFAGTLRIGVIPTIGPYLLPEIAPVLRKRYPKLTFVWSEDKTAVLTAKLARMELDGAILALESDIGDLPYAVLGKDPFVFAAPPGHPLAASKRPVKPVELEGQHVLLLDDGHCFRDQALSFCANVGAEEESYRATSLATLVQMAAGGAGVTLLPALSVPVENRREPLSIRPFAPRAPGRTVVLAWRKGSPLSVSLRAVGETLKAAYRRAEASAWSP